MKPQPLYIYSPAYCSLSVHLRRVINEIERERAAYQLPEPDYLSTNWRDDGPDDGINGWVTYADWDSQMERQLKAAKR